MDVIQIDLTPIIGIRHIYLQGRAAISFLKTLTGRPDRNLYYSFPQFLSEPGKSLLINVPGGLIGKCPILIPIFGVVIV